MWNLLLCALGCLALFYGAVTLALFWLQRRLIYPAERAPRKPTATASTLAWVCVRTADGLELRGRYRAPARPDGVTVLLLHGNGEDLSQRTHVAHDLVGRGYGVFQAEYRGFGGNPGVPHEAGLYADGRAALAFLAERSRRIVIHGYSLGSGVAVQLATEHPLAALILEAPFTSVADVAAAWLPLFPVRRLIRDRYDNLVKIPTVTVPLLIYGGTADRVIPLVHFTRLYAAAGGKKRLEMIERASHINAWSAGGRDIVMEFLGCLVPERDDADQA